MTCARAEYSKPGHFDGFKQWCRMQLAPHAAIVHLASAHPNGLSLYTLKEQLQATLQLSRTIKTALLKFYVASFPATLRLKHETVYAVGVGEAPPPDPTSSSSLPPLSSAPPAHPSREFTSSREAMLREAPSHRSPLAELAPTDSPWDDVGIPTMSSMARDAAQFAQAQAQSTSSGQLPPSSRCKAAGMGSGFPSQRPAEATPPMDVETLALERLDLASSHQASHDPPLMPHMQPLPDLPSAADMEEFEKYFDQNS